MIFAAAASVGWWLFFRFLYLLISIFTTQTPPSPSPTLSLVSRGIKWENERWRWPREIGRTGGKYNHHVFLEICDLITFTSLLKSLSLITRFFRFQKGKIMFCLSLFRRSSVIFSSHFIIVVLFLLYQHLYLPRQMSLLGRNS